MDPGTRTAALASQGDAQSAKAAERAGMILGPAVVAAAQAAVGATKADSGAGINEGAADLAQVRAALATALAERETALAGMLTAAALDALVAGWHAELAMANQELPDGLDLVAAYEDPGLAEAMRGWPIVGHTAEESATHLARSWRYQADGLAGNAAATGRDADLVDLFLDLTRRTEAQAKAMVAEAFHAGAGAARLAIPAALDRMLAEAPANA